MDKYECGPTKGSAYNSSSFDFSKYLLSYQIHYQCDIIDFSISGSKKRIDYLLLNFRNELIQKFSSNQPVNLLINSLILGNNNFNDEIKESINKLGISHLFVISGTHINLYLLFFTHLSGILNLKYSYYKNGITFVLFFIYIMTGLSISTFRVISFYLFNLHFKHRLNIFLFITIWIFFNPFIIYNQGFILTIGLTLFLNFYRDDSNHHFLLKALRLNFFLFCYTIPFQLQFNALLNPLSFLINWILIIIFPFLIGLIIATLLFPFSGIVALVNLLIYSGYSLLKLFTPLNFHLPTIPFWGWYLFFYFFISLVYFKKNKLFILLLFLLVSFVPKTTQGVFLFYTNNHYITVVKTINETYVVGEINEYNVKELMKFLRQLTIYQVDYLIFTKSNQIDASVINQFERNFTIKNITYH